MGNELDRLVRFLRDTCPECSCREANRLRELTERKRELLHVGLALAMVDCGLAVLWLWSLVG